VDLIATLQCADQPGIVHAMTSSVLAAEGNIIENQQFTDPVTNTFVMRTRFESATSLARATEVLASGLAKFNSQLKIRDNSSPKRALVMSTRSALFA
jgi:formyltetrahydrofolate deformylase